MKNATKKYTVKDGYQRRGTKQAPESFADFSVLFDGDTLPEEPAPAPTPTPEASAPSEPALREAETAREHRPTAPSEVLTPAVLMPHHVRLVGPLDHKPGEDGWTYLDRITPLLLKELVALATAPPSVINAKVKLEALKELIQRPMPARQVYDIRTPPAGSEFDRMSDAQVMDFVHQKIADMRKEEIADTPAPEPAPDTPAPDKPAE